MSSGTSSRTIWTPAPGSAAAIALDHVARTSAGDGLDPSLEITLQFHPDRLHKGEALLRVLAREGVYRSQFETGTSNGGLTAQAGGDRWRWESRIFGGAYDLAAPEERPKYGALNYRRRPVGGAPRFGSSYFRLRPAVLHRTTFCYPDSVYEPRDFGTAASMSLVDLAKADARDPLDDAIEAHVHGPVRLAFDVEALVLDPSFRGSAVEEQARSLDCALQWHAGFRLRVQELGLHPDYRGVASVQLGQEIAEDGVLTPAIVDRAANSGAYDAPALKKVWHCLARFGDLSTPTAADPAEPVASQAAEGQR